MCYISLCYLLMECDSLLFIVDYHIVLQCTCIAFKRGKLLWCRLISCEGACLWVLLLRCLICRKFIVVLCWVDNCNMCRMTRWDGQPRNHTFQLLSKHGVSPVRPHCANARRNRCQEDLNSFPLGELEETTRTPLYYMNEGYPSRPEIQQPLLEWSN